MPANLSLMNQSPALPFRYAYSLKGFIGSDWWRLNNGRESRPYVMCRNPYPTPLWVII